ncbi:MAG: SufD family Fe-S cluster assembly protein [Fervidicoccaceae archaeon]|nr:MAG: hypothetical protein C0179_03150 [Fervidicoccus sp.]
MSNDANEKLTEALGKAKELGIDVEKGGSIVLNETMLFRRLSEELEKKGIIYTEIHEAAKEYSDIFEKHAFMKVRGSLKEIDSGVFLYVPRGVILEKPIFNCFVLGKRGIVQRIYNLIIIEDDSKAIGLSGCFTLVNEAIHSSLEEIHVGSNASFTKVMLHNWLPKISVSAFTAVQLGRGGKYQDIYVNYSEARSISFNTRIYHEGDYSASRADQIIATSGTGDLKYSTEVFLSRKGTSSQLISRLLSRDRGKIKSKTKIVAEEKETKGHIDCKGMLLGDGGEISTIPELSSMSSDAELTHEASIGKIKKEELEYLETKGFTEEQAISLLVRGFLETGTTGLPESIKNSIDNILERLSRAKG